MDLALGPGFRQMGSELGVGWGVGALAHKSICVVTVGKTQSSCPEGLTISLPGCVLCLHVLWPLFCALRVRGQKSRIYHGPEVIGREKGCCRRHGQRELR